MASEGSVIIQALGDLRKALGRTNSRVVALESNGPGSVWRNPRIAAILRSVTDAQPRYYSILISFNAGATDARPGTTTIDQQGYFICMRFWMSWLVEEGDNAGRFRPISSGNPIIAAAVGGVPADTIDFLWGYKTGRADIHRANENILLPSDILYRQDRDGYPPAGDLFAQNETVTFTIAPTRPVEHRGTMKIVLSGIQTYDVLGQ